ncbi:heavy-metal-associated domain-containing protein [Paenirhodobacter populi]|uniref:Copper chaperone n=1 Tax=Paenirhodobacter populi TaxID=2306993 RepID=A0A443KGF2_9RHOB|nr:heavy-metal-associated domain-containing protein [Sinirhodobacter populi]RWR12663.1 copper chaperone [Sinirhodobacter populi]RWR22482.1 copper chaperone [Sinirhodobacter populi]RWR31830.1 copper chaperone [Sinirhodobacter populi]
MILSVPDMTCEQSRASVEAAITEVGGRAIVSLEDREIEVNGLPESTVLAALKAAGFTAEVIA